MKNRDVALGACGAIVGVLVGAAMYTSTHESFHLSASSILAYRLEDKIPAGLQYQYKRDLQHVPFYNKPKAQGSSSSSSSSVAPVKPMTLCETVTTIVDDVRGVVTKSIPSDQRYEKFLHPILRKLMGVEHTYCTKAEDEQDDKEDLKGAAPMKIDNDCERFGGEYSERARYTTCKRYEDAGYRYP